MRSGALEAAGTLTDWATSRKPPALAVTVYSPGARSRRNSPAGEVTTGGRAACPRGVTATCAEGIGAPVGSRTTPDTAGVCAASRADPIVTDSRTIVVERHTR